jgi:hypothetical protein
MSTPTWQPSPRALALLAELLRAVRDRRAAQAAPPQPAPRKGAVQ